MGYIKANGIHFGHIAIWSFDWGIGFNCFIGKIYVDFNKVAKCGCFINIMLHDTYVGWWEKRRKLYAPGSFNGFVFMLYCFYN